MEFAVSKYNRQAQGKSSEPKLVLDSMACGELQVLHVLKYRLVLSAKNDSLVSNPMATATSDKYEAIVWDMFWQPEAGLLRRKEVQLHLPSPEKPL